ncbi:hypothetical protein D9M69_697290 [compost metagenome]
MMAAPNGVIKRRAFVGVLPPPFWQGTTQNKRASLVTSLPFWLHPLLNPAPRQFILARLFLGPVPETDHITAGLLLGMSVDVFAIEIREDYAGVLRIGVK